MSDYTLYNMSDHGEIEMHHKKNLSLAIFVGLGWYDGGLLSHVGGQHPKISDN